MTTIVFCQSKHLGVSGLERVNHEYLVKQHSNKAGVIICVKISVVTMTTIVFCQSKHLGVSGLERVNHEYLVKQHFNKAGVIICV